MFRMQSVGVALTVVNFLILAVLASGAAVSAAPETVRAERFQLVDGQGRVRGELRTTDDTVLFVLNGERDKHRVILSAADTGAALTLYGGGEKYMAVLGAGTRAGTVLGMTEPGYKTAVGPKELRRLYAQ